MQPGTYCTNCGAELRGRSRFCTNCGAERAKPPVSPSSGDPGATAPFRVADMRQPPAGAGPAPSGLGVTQPMSRPTAPRAADAADPGATLIIRPADVPTPTAAAEPAAVAPPAIPAARRHKWYRPGLITWGIFLGVTVVAYIIALVVADPHDPLAYWNVVRATGFLTYELISVAVALGTYMSWRLNPFTGFWLVAERLHPLFLMVAGVAASAHIVGMLMLEFPPVHALVPFTSIFRPGPMSIGILSTYLGIILVASTYMIRWIGFKTWRRIHYLGYVAWLFALLHGLGTGHETGTAWAKALYLAGAALVLATVIVLLARYAGVGRSASTEAAAA